MALFDKHLRIAVIGSVSSGKSFLLFDLIHAFHHLGFAAQALPLSYPHSSFGSFFYDVINVETGGMRGTESYDCRPSNHYGAIFTRSRLLPFWRYHVDFLNIPGEAFADHETIDKYFELKKYLEREQAFWLSTWKSPSGHAEKLILPHPLRDKRPDSWILEKQELHCGYKDWAGVVRELSDGSYKEYGKRRCVSGKYILQHISELQTDAVLLTLRSWWKSKVEPTVYGTYPNVFRYFYFFTYCQLATDLVICDRLTEQHSTKQLMEDVCHFMTLSGACNPHVYLSFRGIDKFMKYRKMEPPVRDSVKMRNHVYSLFHKDISLQLSPSPSPPRREESLIHLPEKEKQHIMQTCGNGIGWGFWNLLNHAVKQQPSWKYKILKAIYDRPTVSEMAARCTSNLPPHVFFIATPIDSEGRIYRNDTDVTRFIYEDGTETKSFLRETCADMTRHGCFGSLQLLVDILLQNGVWLNAAVTGSDIDIIKYIQTKPIK